MSVRSIVLPAILLLLTATCAPAAVIVSGEQTQQYIPGGSPVLVDFFITLTGADAGGIQVSNFQMRVELIGSNAGTAASITGVGETVRHVQAEPLAQTSVNPAGTSAFASTLNLGPAFMITNNEGLMRVNLQFGPSASGTYVLDILTASELDTQLLNASSQPIAFTTQDGQVTAVPEPGSLLLAVVAAGVGSGTWLRRRRRAM